MAKGRMRRWSTSRSWERCYKAARESTSAGRPGQGWRSRRFVPAACHGANRPRHGRGLLLPVPVPPHPGELRSYASATAAPPPAEQARLGGGVCLELWHACRRPSPCSGPGTASRMSSACTSPATTRQPSRFKPPPPPAHSGVSRRHVPAAASVRRRRAHSCWKQAITLCTTTSAPRSSHPPVFGSGLSFICEAKLQAIGSAAYSSLLDVICNDDIRFVVMLAVLVELTLGDQDAIQSP